MRSIIYVAAAKRRPDWFEVIHLYGTEGGWNKLKTLVDAHEDAAARQQAFVDRIAPAARKITVLLHIQNFKRKNA